MKKVFSRAAGRAPGSAARRRRRPLLLPAAVMMGLAALLTVTAEACRPVTAGPHTQSISRGRFLFLQSCAGCHGQNGEGSEQAPSLIDVGAAAADFYLTTGRMPLQQPYQRPTAGKPKFPPGDIKALDQYVGSLGHGPAIPQIAPGILNSGRELFASNCAACHSATETGEVQVAGKPAPTLRKSTPLQIAEAARVGPGLMPSFSSLTPSQVNDLVTYVHAAGQDKIQQAGGSPLGSLGPVSEALVGFVGLGVIVLFVRVLGSRS